MNKFICMGRLTKDPEVRYGSTAVARFTIAVDRRFKRDGEPDTDFFNAVAFGKTAEFAEKYLKKGTKVLAEGRIENGSYTNKDGAKVYTTTFMIDAVEFAESKGASETTTQTATPAQPKTNADGFMEIPDGLEVELPFM